MKLADGLKFEIVYTGEHQEKLTIYFQRPMSLSRFTDSESRTGADKELCSRSTSKPVAELRAN